MPNSLPTADHSRASPLGLDEVSVTSLGEQSAKRLRRSQIRGAIRQSRLFVMGNTLFAPFLSFQAWDMADPRLVIGWTVIMVSFSWWLFWAWRDGDKAEGTHEDMRTLVAQTRLVSFLWCLGMVLFYPYVEGDAKVILTTVMAGSLMLGTFGYSPAPPAAFWYLGIHATTLVFVPFYHGAFGGTVSDFMIGLLALIASFEVFSTTLERAKAQMKAFKNTETLAQKNEVVDLLLKDYEEQGAEGTWRTNESGHLVACSRHVLESLNINESQAINTDFLSLLFASQIENESDSLKKAAIAVSLREDFHDVNLPITDSETGRVRWMNLRGRPQFDEGMFIGYRGIVADATATIEAKREIQYLAEHDSLTRLFNRNLVQQRLSELNAQQDSVVLYLIDLDGFKQVNDSYGHTIGDELLKLIADRISQTVGSNGLVARLGGDEFCVVVTKDDRLPDALLESLGARLIWVISQRCAIQQYDISISASIGTAQFPRDTEEGVNLLNLADLALYAAKENGRNRCTAFKRSMQEGLQRLHFVAERLRQAVDQNEVYPVYQPQYSAKSGQLIGLEALARWEDAELGLVGPDVFIPIAEDTGLIHKMGEAMLRQACEDVQTLDGVVGLTKPTVAVNLSALQIMSGDTVQLIERVLRETCFPADRLEIEVTESVLIEDIDGSHALLNDLSRLGITIALDDFGTGYSSLSYVRKLPLDKIKIDRSFVLAMPEQEATSIIETIVGMCKKLKIQTVAEGVETQGHVEDLRRIGCDILQGYHFARPMTLDDLRTFLESHELSA